jgi:hypothetical protein
VPAIALLPHRQLTDKPCGQQKVAFASVRPVACEPGTDGAIT